MFKNEHEFSKILRAWLEDRDCAFQSIESGGIAVGIPDAFFSSARLNMRGWLELKNEGEITKARYKVAFRPGQYSWMRRFSRQGTFCALVIAWEHGIAFFGPSDLKLEYTRDEIMKSSFPSYGADFITALQGAYDAFKKNHDDFYKPFDDAEHSVSVNPISGHIRESSADDGVRLVTRPSSSAFPGD